ncbi:MAG: S-layer homology domain-containing protein [Oscillospiraceae bacterium]|nr:S-layer homology domain-containing protein [Oscillospiraceae bacterium]
MKKLHRFAALVVTLCLVIAVIPANLSRATTYSDTATHWANAAIERWSDLGVLLGSDGKFRPDASITRAELAAILNRVLKFPATDERFYTDTSGKWYDADINAVALQGVYIVDTGLAQGDRALTREEAVEMMFRAFWFKSSMYNANNVKFTDGKDVSEDYATAVENFRARNFISGFPDGSFKPKGSFTRAQVVTILNNVIGTYITEPGTYNFSRGARICVAAPNVTLNTTDNYGVEYLVIAPGAVGGRTVVNSNSLGLTTAWGLHLFDNADTFVINRPPSEYYPNGATETYGGISGAVANGTLSDFMINVKPLRTVDHAFASGSGRAGDPYMITSQSELRLLENYIGQMSTYNAFALANDIALSGTWEPIGQPQRLRVAAANDGVSVLFSTAKAEQYIGDHSFNAVLDGRGHAITGLDVRFSGTDSMSLGLFGAIGGTVRNLRVTGKITGEMTGAFTGSYTSSARLLHAGAIAGIMSAQAETYLIDNCTADIAINLTVNGTAIAGGLVGEILGGRIYNSSATGNVSAASSFAGVGTSGNTSGTISFAGGLVGKADSAGINGSVSTVNVTAIGGYNVHSGGIAGFVSGTTIQNCFASGKIRASDPEMQSDAGGLVGMIKGSSTKVISSAAAADVTASGDPLYFNAASGLVGNAQLGAKITDCYSAGTVTADGSAVVGGLVGRVGYVVATTSYTVTRLSAPGSWSDYTYNGLTGSYRDSIVVLSCGVFNVGEPHFTSFRSKTDEQTLRPAGNRSLFSRAVYDDLGTYVDGKDTVKWDFDTVWTFASDGTYKYPILRGISAQTQKSLRVS